MNRIITSILFALWILSLAGTAEAAIWINTNTPTFEWIASVDPPPASGGEPAGLDGYNLYIGKSEATRAKVNPTLITATEYQHTMTNEDIGLFAWVEAVDRAGNATFSLPSEEFGMDKTAPIWSEGAAPTIKVPAPTP